MNQDSININSIDFKGSICDGPGIRTVIYLQGCDMRCEGCHNSQTWNVNEGNIISVQELFENINQKSVYRRITISGGEPLIQLEAVYKLTELLKMAGFDIALYTGFDLKGIPAYILKNLNYIKYGKYDKNLSSTIIPYVGSLNQKFKAVHNGEIYE